MTVKLKEAKEETQQIRQDCQAIIKTYQVGQDQPRCGLCKNEHHFFCNTVRKGLSDFSFVLCQLVEHWPSTHWTLGLIPSDSMLDGYGRPDRWGLSLGTYRTLLPIQTTHFHQEQSLKTVHQCKLCRSLCQYKACAHTPDYILESNSGIPSLLTMPHRKPHYLTVYNHCIIEKHAGWLPNGTM